MRPRQAIAAGRIEDQVDLTERLDPAGGRVIEDLVSAQLAHDIQTAGRGGSDDVRASPPSQLHGQATDGSGGSEDGHALPRLQATMFEQTLP